MVKLVEVRVSRSIIADGGPRHEQLVPGGS